MVDAPLIPSNVISLKNLGLTKRPNASVTVKMMRNKYVKIWKEFAVANIIAFFNKNRHFVNLFILLEYTY